MDVELNFDPAEAYEEVSSVLEDLELSGGWEILAHKSYDVLKKRKDQENATIYSSETIIKRLPEEISAAILDFELRKQWDIYLINSESLVQWGKNLQLIYMQQRFKWPLSDRDYVLIQGVTKDPDVNKITIGWKSVEYNKKPRTPAFVRGSVEYSGFVITKVSEDSSHITFIDKSFFNGSIPEFMLTYMEKKNIENLMALKNFLLS